MIFEKVRNLNGSISQLPVVINLFGSRERLADAIGSTVQRLPLDYIEKEKPIPPVVIDKSKAMVKGVIQKGDDVDLYELPIVTHHEMDLGPYFVTLEYVAMSGIFIALVLIDGLGRFIFLHDNPGFITLIQVHSRRILRQFQCAPISKRDHH